MSSLGGSSEEVSGRISTKHNLENIGRDSSPVNCSTKLRRSIHKEEEEEGGGSVLPKHASLVSDWDFDSIGDVQEQIRRLTGMSIMEHLLIHRVKKKQQQLGWQGEECNREEKGKEKGGRRSKSEIKNNILLRRTRQVKDLVLSIFRLCRGDSDERSETILARVKDFIDRTPNSNALEHFRTFESYGAPMALVMLFLSPIEGNKDIAEESIRLFLNSKTGRLQTQCAPIIFEFSKWLLRTANDEPLYATCRETLASLLEVIGVPHGSRCFGNATTSTVIREIFPFVRDLAGLVHLNLELIMKSPFCFMTPSIGLELQSTIREFTIFLRLLHKAIKDHLSWEGQFPVSLSYKNLGYLAEIGSLYGILLKLLQEVDQSFNSALNVFYAEDFGNLEMYLRGFFYSLSVLKELNNISKLYQGAKEAVHSVMSSNCCLLNVLIRFSERSDKPLWILEHVDILCLGPRIHLVMMMLPEVKDEYEQMHQMLIDRSQLLKESFGYIAHADPNSLQRGLLVEFKNEFAMGPGVLREWFFLVCKALFNPNNSLFLACPYDRRRFFPNPASKVNPLHLNYFVFCGRVIALALMYKVQVGIAIDRIFFSELAGEEISLEDVSYRDPCMYNSCKKILEMDADFIDSDALGLTFVWEIEEFGSRKVVELCPGGNNVVVNSTNREEYVKLLIQHCYVKNVSEQVASFAQGFGDILCKRKLQKIFFQSLEFKDLDQMLLGSDTALCVEDWKAHTNYNGYKENDDQICWFWKVVEDMSVEQQRVLLFFWTSVKYLPEDGFSSLPSRLYIFKTSDSHDRLPSSQTCFYRLSLPPYPSLAIMQQRLFVIGQEHLSCSFGNS